MSAHLSFARFAWRNLWRRRFRTLLTLFGIGMAIAAFVALVGFSNSFESEWKRAYESSGTDIAVVQKTFLNTSVDESDGAVLMKLPDVASISPMILNMMDLTPEVNALAFGWKADTYEFESLTFLSGGRFHEGKPEVILGELLASNLHKQVGDTLDIQGTGFKVVGIFHGASALEEGAAILPLDELQEISSLQGKVTTFHVRLRPAPHDVSEKQYLKQAQAQIETALPGLRAIPAVERATNNQLVGAAHAAAWGTSLIALLIGILGIANTMAMSVFERTKEIGILRAIGWKRWSILLLIEFEASVLGLAGGILGIGIGFGALRMLSRLPQTASIVTSSIPPSLLVEAVIVAIVAGLLAGAVPAWRGAKLSPVEALRHE